MRSFNVIEFKTKNQQNNLIGCRLIYEMKIRAHHDLLQLTLVQLSVQKVISLSPSTTSISTISGFEPLEARTIPWLYSVCLFQRYEMYGMELEHKSIFKNSTCSELWLQKSDLTCNSLQW